VARNETFISVPPEQVFELLSDPRTYGYWVPGARKVRAADPDWPVAGAAFDHSVGVGWLSLRDHTSVVDTRPNEQIELRARARPMPSARVTLTLHPEANGTRVTMTEAPANPVLSLMLGPVGHLLLKLRNVESLRRLKQLAEGQAPLPTGRLPPRKHADG
jgi:uncharacterized protein YndB with AHSA1/START domain